jgi:hypothetical protein
MVSAMVTQQVEFQNIRGGSQAREFLINEVSCQFTIICRKLACFLPHVHQNVPADKMRRTFLPWLNVGCTRVLEGCLTALCSSHISLSGIKF